jgi:hypothetical protein
MGFFSDLFGGPSSQQESLNAQEVSMNNVFNSAFQSYLGSQSAVLQNIGNILTPIAQAGPTQQGFGAQELAALNTQATQGIGQNYNKASQALNLQESTRGGGNQVLPTGAANEQKENLAAAAANQESNAQLGITNANYAQGNANWRAATSGLQALGQDYNPSSFGSLGNTANNQAFGQASQIQQEQQQAADAPFALAGSVAMDALGGVGNLDFQGTSTGGEQLGNFVSGFGH